MVSAIAFGTLVSHYGNYTAPFVPMAALLALGVCLWFLIDPTRPLIPESHPA